MVSELKELMCEELAGRYTAGIDYVVVGYTGLKAQESSELRRKLRQGNVRMEVVKNSIARRVFEANGLGQGAHFIDGPSALITGTVEMPALCKLLRDLSKEYADKLSIRGGMYDGAPIDDSHRPDDKKIRCETCSRVIPPWSDHCPACMSKRKVLGRLLDFVKPYKKRAIIGIVMALIVMVLTFVPSGVTRNQSSGELPKALLYLMSIFVGLPAWKP